MEPLDATWTVTNVDAQTVDRLASQHTPDARAAELGVDLIADPHREDDAGNIWQYNIWGSKPGHLILEITEDAVVRNPKASFAALGLLRKAGIQVSIDDFGTGYSSMTYFKDMPADEIKIDKSFVKDLAHDAGNQHIVRAVIDLAHAFHYKVVAEGVESEDVLDVLKGMQCDIAQGFLFARPQPQADFIQFLTDYGRKALPVTSLESNSR